MKHQRVIESLSNKDKMLHALRLRIIADGMKDGVGLTPEQQGCREREEFRTGVPQYNVKHYNDLIARSNDIWSSVSWSRGSKS